MNVRSIASSSCIRTGPPLNAIEANFPLSLGGTQAASKTVTAGNNGPELKPMNTRNTIKKIKAFSPPEKIYSHEAFS